MRGNAAEDKKKAGRTSRLEARIDSEQKALIERAAALQGCSLSTFVITSAREAAIKTIREHEVIRLAGPDREAFISALMNPSRPTRKMREAARRYKKEAGQ
ncbi:MAG: DUF1778 domain-containing protein, partial [Nitrospiria bacterium]